VKKKPLCLFLVAVLGACASHKEKRASIGTPSAGLAKRPPSREASRKSRASRRSADTAPTEAAVLELKSDAAELKERPQAGSLTAGSFDDVSNPKAFRKFVGGLKSQEQERFWQSPERILRLRVEGRDGFALPNAAVTIAGKSYRTKRNGSLVLCSAWDEIPRGPTDISVQAVGASQAETIKVSMPQDEAPVVVRVTGAVGKTPKRLELALIIDATGSMSDELRYITSEIEDIARGISRRFPKIEQRFALVIYRDKGDQYVVRSFDFAPLESFCGRLREQTASGGGDYPEAMDEALSAANQLSWTREETVRLGFLIADAPPHDDKLAGSARAIEALRGQGVVLYPIAGSGVQWKTELVMRSAAIITGGRYVFLTDDSGIGLPHAEPKLPGYDVEYLNRLMLRFIRMELGGEEIGASPREIIRKAKAKAKPAAKPAAGTGSVRRPESERKV